MRRILIIAGLLLAATAARSLEHQIRQGANPAGQPAAATLSGTKGAETPRSGTRTAAAQGSEVPGAGTRTATAQGSEAPGAGTRTAAAQGSEAPETHPETQETEAQVAGTAAGTAAGTPGQADAPNPEYCYPILEVSGLCSANFGELRPGHFHAGVDIKTEGTEGKPLVAVADGYVSRISVTAGGYGRALYLVLRNGRTAVYGHLQRFRDDLERLVTEERYRRGSNGADLRFDAGQWPVRQGDIVGYSGNSGSSMGPHLHFEMREGPTQRRCNLVRERIIRPEDNLPPRIVRLHYTETDTVQGVPVHSPLVSYAVVREGEGRYRLTRGEPLPVGRRGYFVAEVTDRRNGVDNTFGVWRVALWVDDEPRFEYRMDGFTYEQARCCDAVSHYPLQLTSRQEVIRLAQMSGAPDDFYPVMEERGILRTAPGEERRIRIEAEDDSGNRSQLTFTVRGRAESFRAQADTAAVVLRHDRAGTVRIGGELTARIPAGALYEPLFCRPARLAAPRADTGLVVLSPFYRLFDARTPLHNPVTVSIRAAVPRRLQLRAVVAVRTAKGRLVCAGGSIADGAVTVTTRSTGDLAVVADTLPPAVKRLFRDGADLSRAASLRFSATDNFSGIASWSLHIDSRRVPCDRFPMRGTLVHTFDTPPDGRRHTAVLTVTDGCGNTARRTGTFYR